MVRRPSSAGGETRLTFFKEGGESLNPVRARQVCEPGFGFDDEALVERRPRALDERPLRLRHRRRRAPKHLGRQVERCALELVAGDDAVDEAELVRLARIEAAARVDE